MRVHPVLATGYYKQTNKTIIVMLCGENDRQRKTPG